MRNVHPRSPDCDCVSAEPAQDIDNAKRIHAVVKTGAASDGSKLELPVSGVSA